MATYVMSDLHGLQNRFLQMLDTIHFTDKDTLYILGDVIDRGNDGIALLQRIQKIENIHLLMGNHEHMMLEYMQAEKSFQEGKDVFESMTIMRRWDLNHNAPTKEAFLALSIDEQKDLMNYIETLPLAYPRLSVGDQTYYLVHATPHDETYDEDIITLAWCKERGIEPFPFVWERSDGSIDLPDKLTLIFGHTITGFYHNKQPYEIWTNTTSIQDATILAIDCGCAANNHNTRLCCVRLDDREVFYV